MCVNLILRLGQHGFQDPRRFVTGLFLQLYLDFTIEKAAWLNKNKDVEVCSEEPGTRLMLFGLLTRFA